MHTFCRTFLFLLLPALAQAQYITHGPVTGAVTPTSARIYLRSLSPASIVLQADSNPAFTNPLSFNGQTIAENDTSAILSLTGLQPGTRYHLRVLVNNQADSLQASFKTFPPEGSRTPLSLAVLSCQEYGTYNTFPSLVRQNPDLVLHTGDWTYPDYQLPGDHRMDTATLKISYQRRYAEPKMPASLRRSAYDYVVDNHDGIGARTNVSYTWFERDSVSGAIRNLIGNDPTPPGAFENMMYAYQTYFPAYPLYDANDGMYHSYRMGNIEIFFVDVRNCGNEQDSSYRFDSINQVWLWDPKPGQTLLGAKQFNWLLSGLRNSTADWKIIVSGIMFNRAFRKVAQVSLALQGLYFDAGGQSGTGFRLAHAVISNWPGLYSRTRLSAKFYSPKSDPGCDGAEWACAHQCDGRWQKCRSARTQYRTHGRHRTGTHLLHRLHYGYPQYGNCEGFTMERGRTRRKQHQFQKRIRKGGDLWK